MNLIKNIDAKTYKNNSFSTITETIINDLELNLYIDNSYNTSLYTIPDNIDILLTGYIFYKFKKIINDFSIQKNKDNFDVYVNLKDIETKTLFQNVPDFITPSLVLESYFDFNNNSSLFRQTAGVHNSALYIDNNREIFLEDISRQSVILKMVGYLIKKNLFNRNVVIITSSRVNNEIIDIIDSLNIKLLLSRATISFSGLENAKLKDMTIIGFIKQDRFTVFCGDKRIKLNCESK